MGKQPSISDAEWEVMNVIWGSSPITASEIVARLSGPRSWSPRTIKTMLNRLVNKGVLEYEAEGKRYLYRPKLPRERWIRREASSFLQRVFSGAGGELLVHFVQNVQLSDQEIEELKRLLARKGK